MSDYWLVFIISTLLYFLIGTILDPLFAKMVQWLRVPLIIAMIFIYLWINFATEVRRLHDIGHSGFWVFLHIIPLIGTFILFIWGGFIDGESEEKNEAAKLSEESSHSSE